MLKLQLAVGCWSKDPIDVCFDIFLFFTRSATVGQNKTLFSGQSTYLLHGQSQLLLATPKEDQAAFFALHENSLTFLTRQRVIID